MDAKTKKTIRDGVSADKIVFKRDGSVEFKRSYFYRHGATAEVFGERVRTQLTALRLAPTKLETSDAWKAWPADSYFIATVSF